MVCLGRSRPYHFKFFKGCLLQVVFQNDGTNSWLLLSIEIIDKMYEFSSSQNDTLISEITNVIKNFPIKFSPYGDTYQFADVYTILFKNHLLSHEMEFPEKLVDNNKLYSFKIQNELE